MFSFSKNLRRCSRSHARRRSCTRTEYIYTDPNEENDINAEVVRTGMEKLIEQESSFKTVQELRVFYEEGKTDPLPLSYTCQLAHGSLPIKVTNFSSVGELYAQMANAFGINCDDIIFCTINTYKVDMNRLFTSCIDPGDMLYAHIRGHPVEVELTKAEKTVGITVADNGMCHAFIKRIKEGSIAGAARHVISTGQQIVSIQGQSVLGLRHYEVAKVINKIPIGQSFVMRLISPLTSGFSFIQPKNKFGKQQQTKGMGTIRFKASGGVVLQMDGRNEQIIDKLNDLFDTYLGVQDDELAETIWDTAQTCKTLTEMMQKIRGSELQEFDFPDELIFDMWGIVSDLARMRK